MVCSSSILSRAFGASVDYWFLFLQKPCTFIKATGLIVLENQARCPHSETKASLCPSWRKIMISKHRSVTTIGDLQRLLIAKLMQNLKYFECPSPASLQSRSAVKITRLNSSGSYYINCFHVSIEMRGGL